MHHSGANEIIFSIKAALSHFSNMPFPQHTPLLVLIWIRKVFQEQLELRRFICMQASYPVSMAGGRRGRKRAEHSFCCGSDSAKNEKRAYLPEKEK